MMKKARHAQQERHETSDEMMRQMKQKLKTKRKPLRKARAM